MQMPDVLTDYGKNCFSRECTRIRASLPRV